MTKRLKYSQTEPRELKVVETRKVVARLKESQPLYLEVLKNVCKLTQHLENNAPYEGLNEALTKLADHVEGDIGEAYKTVVGTQQKLMEEQGKVTTTWIKNVQEEYLDKDASQSYSRSNRIETDKQKLLTFVKDYGTNRTSSLKSVKKAESEFAKANKKKALKKDSTRAEKATEQLKEMIDSHNEFLSDELKSIALIERKKYTGLLKQLNMVLDSQARAFEAALQHVKQCQEQIGNLLDADDEAHLPAALKEIIISGPSLVDKKTGDIEMLQGSGTFVSPRGDEKQRKNSVIQRSSSDVRSTDSLSRKPESPPPPSRPYSMVVPQQEDTLDSYLNALNTSATFFTPLEDDHDSNDESEDEKPAPPARDPLAELMLEAGEGDALHSLLKSFEGGGSA